MASKYVKEIEFRQKAIEQYSIQSANHALRNHVLTVAGKSVLNGQGISFDGDDFRLLCQPCVYVLLKGKEPLYVGMSKSGLSRATARVHKQAVMARAECDKVLIYPTISVKAARELERALLAALKPKYNQRIGRVWIHNEILGHSRGNTSD